MSSRSSPARRVASRDDSDIRRTADLKVSWPCISMIWSSWEARMESAPRASQFRTMCPMWPPRPSAGVTSAAPAPSANRAAVPRSVRSMKRLSTSAPITSTFSLRPPSTWAAASASAERKPVQAAPRSIAPARVAPSSRATSGAALGRISSAATVATRTRSTASAATPAWSRAARPAAAARSWRRSPGDTCRRSYTPVRWTIHCSVTPAPSATLSLVTTRSGTAMATDARAAARCWRSHGMRVAVAAAAGSEAAASRTAALASGNRRSGLRTGCLQGQRLLHQIGQHLPGTAFDEVDHTASVERPHYVEPAHRLGDRAHEQAGDVVERLAGHAGVHGHRRLADLGLVHERAERLHGGLHQRRVERAGHRQPLGADTALLELRLGIVERAEGAGENELIGGVVVGDRDRGHLGDQLTVALSRANGRHATVAGLLGGLLHQPPAGGNQTEAVLVADGTGGHERGDLAEGVTGHQVRLDALAQRLPARERRAEDRGLCPAGAVCGAFEQLGTDLAVSELEQGRAVALHRLPHISCLAALPREEQRSALVASHI